MKHPQLDTFFTTLAVTHRTGENRVSYFRNRVCSTAGMGPVVLEKWQPLQTTLTAPLELLSTPRLEVWDTSKDTHKSQEALG